MALLTLSMIVKNEEKYLAGCLESVKGIADEIVIVDTGSTDSTVDIAQKYGAKIYNFKWINDFSAARNFALKKSTGRWVLYLDADERLDPKSVSELKEFLKRTEKLACYCFIRSDDDKNKIPSVITYTRFFRNSNNLYFSGKVHEQIEHSLRKERYRFINTSINIIHLGYNITIDGLRVKAQRNLEYLLEDFKKEKNPYLMFQIAQSYGVLGQKEKAVEFFKLITELKENLCEKFFKAHAYRYIAVYNKEYGNIEKAFEFALKGFEYDKTQPILNKVIAELFLLQNDYSRAFEFAKRSYESNNPSVKKDFEIFIDNNIIIYIGLTIAIRGRNREIFNYFYDKYLINKVNDGENYLVELFNAIFNNREIAESLLVKLSQNTDIVNTRVIIEFIHGSDIELREKILQAINEKGKECSEYYAELAAVYEERNMIEKALENYERAIKFEQYNPSLLFYIISLSLKLNKLEKISNMVLELGKISKHNEQLAEKYDLLKNNLSKIIN